MAVTQLTLNYDALLSTTLMNSRPAIIDAIGKSNYFFYKMMKSDSWKLISSIGERAKITLMYELGAADSYSGYDVVNTTPMDGITSAFFDWRQMAGSVSISGEEKKKNKGDNQIASLIEGKITQMTMGIQEKFARCWAQGNGVNSATAVTAAYVSPVNGSSFIEPLGLQIAYDPTAALTIGGIAQDTASNAWWRNKRKDSTSTTYAGFLKEMDNLYNSCTLGGGGANKSPDIHVMDQSSYEMYCAALRSQNRYTSYTKADIPFESVNFHGHPAMFDEWIIDAQGGSTSQSTSSGTWYMLNSHFMEVQVEADTNFATTGMVRPENQDAWTGLILWMGAALVSNRRKLGVAGGIDTTLTS